MKITKKISFKRAKSLTEEFKVISEKFIELKKNTTKDEGVKRIKSLSELNYFVVVEFINVADKIDYEKIFPNNDYIVDVEGLLNEQDKVIQHINKRKVGYPDVFYKLGLIHEVTGCFLIATRKTNIDNISTKNTKNTISVRMKYSSLPREIIKMCSDFQDSRTEIEEKEEQEFDRFNKLSFEEQDIILQNILHNADSGSVDFFYTSENKSSKNSENSMSGYTGAKLEEVFNYNLERITSVEFLKSLLAKAIDKENYEFCAKIRDRLSFLEAK